MLLRKLSACILLLFFVISIPRWSWSAEPVVNKLMADNIVEAAGLQRPDDHAPIGVMQEHTHKKKELMASYRFMFMNMDGSRIGHKQVGDGRVLRDFPVTPTEMEMMMHMIGLMYAPSDNVTFMAMLPIIRKDMNHLTRAGVKFRTHSEGVGDLKLSALVPIYKKSTEKTFHKVHLNAGMSFPIGEINETHDTPIGKGIRLPYPMQLGSGTWDILPGITYTGSTNNWSWGAQGLVTIHPGRNRIGYALGNQYDVNVWGARKIFDWMSASLRFHYSIWQNIDGRDSSLVPAMVPLADPNSRGGKRLDLEAGFNFVIPTKVFKNHRLAFEWGVPIMQSLDGPQLETEYWFTVGWQKVF